MRKCKQLPVCLMFCLLLLDTAYSQTHESGKLLSEQVAIDLLVEKIKVTALYDKIECLSFLVEDSTPSYFDIAIRENHRTCPGDPLTSPIVDRFRISRSTREVLCYDFLENEYFAFERCTNGERNDRVQ